MASRQQLRRQASGFQRDAIRVSGLLESQDQIRQQLTAAGRLPTINPFLEQAAVRAARLQSGAALQRQAAATGGGLTGAGALAGQQLVQSAQQGAGLTREGLRLQGRLRRFQLQNQLLTQLQGGSQAGLSASPAAALIQADAQIKSAQIAADAQRKNQLLGFGASILGGAISGGAGVLGASILAEEDD
jgi:hypothetical protein